MLKDMQVSQNINAMFKQSVFLPLENRKAESAYGLRQLYLMFIFWAHLFFCTYYDLLERCVRNVVFLSPSLCIKRVLMRGKCLT